MSSFKLAHSSPLSPFIYSSLPQDPRRAAWFSWEFPGYGWIPTTAGSGRAALTLLRAPAAVFAGKLPSSVRLRQGERGGATMELKLERDVSGDESTGACSMTARSSAARGCSLRLPASLLYRLRSLLDYFSVAMRVLACARLNQRTEPPNAISSLIFLLLFHFPPLVSSQVRVSCPFLLVNRTFLEIAYAPERMEVSEEVQQGDKDAQEGPSAATVVTVSTAVPGRDGGAKMDGEMVMGPGKQALLSPPNVKDAAVGICMRVAGSGTSMPIRLSGGSATVVNAVLPDLKLCQVLVATEPASGDFSRSTAVSVDFLTTLTNRSGTTIRYKQATVPIRPGLTGIWAEPKVLAPGQAGEPLIWEDYMKLQAIEISLEGMGWSRKLSIAQGDFHVIIPPAHLADDGGSSMTEGRHQVVRVTVETSSTGRFHVAFRSTNSATPVRVENLTGVTLFGRQASSLARGGGPWATLRPRSSCPTTWEATWGGGVTAAIELRWPRKDNESVVAGTLETARIVLVPDNPAEGSRSGAHTPRCAPASALVSLAALIRCSVMVAEVPFSSCFALPAPCPGRHHPGSPGRFHGRCHRPQRGRRARGHRPRHLVRRGARPSLAPPRASYAP